MMDLTQEDKVVIEDKGKGFFVRTNLLASSDTINSEAFYIRKESIIEVVLLKAFEAKEVSNGQQ